MQSKEEEMYKCRHLKVNKENGYLIAIEWEGETVYYYVFDGKELKKYIIPEEDFIKKFLEEEI